LLLLQLLLLLLLLLLVHTVEQPHSCRVRNAHGVRSQGGAADAVACVVLKQHALGPAAVQLGLLVHHHNQLVRLACCR
jgi:hypothetical protein